jgi:hypothetical protein
VSEAEEAALDAALQVLEARPGALVEGLAGLDPGEAAAWRHHLEAFSLLALAEPPVAPPAALRERLLARLRGDETQVVPELREGFAARAAAPAAPRPGEGSLLDPALAPPRLAAGRPAAAAKVVPLQVPASPRRWALPLAAALTLVALALGTAAGLLWQELTRVRQRLAASELSRQQLAAQVAEDRREASAESPLRTRLADMEAQLGMVTAAGTEVCALRPPARVALAPEARGLLFVAADHQHWYLSARGLTAPGEGRVYHLWFMVGDRPVSAGSFELRGEEAVLTSPTMPSGTTAAVITVEPAAQPAERPTGPVVLYGNQMSPLL